MSWEIFVLENQRAPDPSEANSHARLSPSNQLMKNMCWLHFLTVKKVFTVATSKNLAKFAKHWASL